jgi:hypothetical protein
MIREHESDNSTSLNLSAALPAELWLPANVPCADEWESYASFLRVTAMS